MRISEFNSLVEPIVKDAIRTLRERDGINALVLDVRGNPGGAFQYDMDISSLFVEGEKVATSLVDGNDVVILFKTDELDRDREANKNDDEEENEDSKGGNFHPVLRDHGQTADSIFSLQTNCLHWKKNWNNAHAHAATKNKVEIRLFYFNLSIM